MKKFTLLFLVLGLVALLAMPTFAAKGAKGSQNASVQSIGNRQVSLEVLPRESERHSPDPLLPNRGHEKAGKAGLNGLYSIGLAVPGGYVANYNKLSEAVAALQTNGAAGAVTFEFTDAAYTDTSVLIGGYAGQDVYTVTFQPKSGVSPYILFTGGTLTSARAYCIGFSNAMNVVFQGSTLPYAPLTPANRKLTIEADTLSMTSPTYYYRRDGIQFFTGNRNILVKDMNVIGWRKWTGTLGPYGIIYGVNSAAGLYNKNLTFQNLTVKRGGYAFNFGPANGVFDTSITIQGCDIGTTKAEPLQYGIGSSNQRGMHIYDNDIKGIYAQGVAPVATSPRGLMFAWGGMYDLQVYWNKIHDIGLDVLNGVVYGIQIHANGGGGSASSDNWRFFNNFIYDLRYDGTRAGGNYQTTEGVYMYDYGPVTTIIGTVRFYYNTINLFGTPAGAPPNGWTGCFVWNDAAGDNFKLAGNILVNGRKGPGGGSIRQDWATNVPGTVTNVGYNVYYAYNGVTPQADGVFFWEATSKFQQDPLFVSNYNPHIKTTIGSVSPAFDAGFAYLADDIDHEVRPSVCTPPALPHVNPCIGADEFCATPWPLDAKPVSLDLPPAGMPLTPGVFPKVTVRNNGSLDVGFQVNITTSDGYNHTEVVPTVTHQTNYQVTFSTLYVPAGLGPVTFTITTMLYSDNDMTNDVLVGGTHVAPTVSSFPYAQNFDAPKTDGGFYAGGSPVWVLGTPAKVFIVGAASAPNAWVTKLTASEIGDNVDAFLYTPFFDFTGIYNPLISFKQMFWMETDWDAATMEWSEDGTTWNKLGGYLDPLGTNWYNSENTQLIDYPAWTGKSNSIAPAYFTSSIYAADVSNKLVQFRFRVQTDGNTNFEGQAIDDFAVDIASSIAGRVRNDGNCNGSDDGVVPEPGLPGTVTATLVPGPGAYTVPIGVNGYYIIPGLPAGTYTVSANVSPFAGTQTEPLPAPPGTYTIVVATNTNYPGNNFGYCWPAHIQGQVYFDQNHDGAKNPTEVGINGVTIDVGGVYSGVTANIGGEDGMYDIAVNIAGAYTVTQNPVPAGYVQYTPTGGIPVTVTYGDIKAGNDFGDAAAKDVLTYRTAVYEEWALCLDDHGVVNKAVKRQPHQCDVDFLVTAPFNCSHVLIKKFAEGGLFIGAIQVNSDPVIDILAPGSASYDIATPVAVGSTIHIQGYTKKDKAKKMEIWWYGTVAPLWKHKYNPADFIVNKPRLPMPNFHNVGEELFPKNPVGLTPYFSTTTPLWVGVVTGGKNPQTVALVKYNDDVKKSMLKAPALIHTGTPACFTPGPLFTSKRSTLAPDKFSFQAFGELLTAKLNVAASLNEMFPIGLGELTFNDETNPGNLFNGMTVNAIIADADKIISCNMPDPPRDVATIGDVYPVLRMIDTAFSGPVDSISFWPRTKMTGVKPLADVAYLYAAPGYAPQKNVLAVGPVVPWSYSLEQNYPNPFNPTTTIQFTLNKPGYVTLKVYNMLGQEVVTLLENVYTEEGLSEQDFDANSLASGIYFYRLTVQSVNDEGVATGQAFTQVKKMMLVK